MTNQQILQAVANVCSVSVDRILSGNKSWLPLRARYIAAEIAAQSLDPDASQSDRDRRAADVLAISEATADRFRSNAQHLYDTDPAFRRDYQRVADRLDLDY